MTGITTETRTVYVAHYGGKTRRFFTLFGAAQWLANKRMVAICGNDCGCGMEEDVGPCYLHSDNGVRLHNRYSHRILRLAKARLCK